MELALFSILVLLVIVLGGLVGVISLGMMKMVRRSHFPLEEINGIVMEAVNEAIKRSEDRYRKYIKSSDKRDTFDSSSSRSEHRPKELIDQFVKNITQSKPGNEEGE